jgi:hypothetical protein
MIGGSDTSCQWYLKLNVLTGKVVCLSPRTGSLSAMSAHSGLDNTLVVDCRKIRRCDDLFCHRLGAAFVGMVVAAVHVFYPARFPLLTLIVFFQFVWRYMACRSMWICFSSESDPSPVSCVQAVYYFTHQNDSWYLKLSVRSSIQIFCLSWFWIISKVTVVMILVTVHQALISHAGGCISLQRSCTILTWRFQSTRTLSRTGEIQVNFSWLSGKELSLIFEEFLNSHLISIP